MNYHGQPKLTAQDAALLPLPEEVNHVVGTTVTTLTAPAGATTLTMICEVNNFRIKAGTHGSLSSGAPGATVSTGTGSVKLVADQKLVIPAPTTITVVGTAAGSILTYYWS